MNDAAIAIGKRGHSPSHVTELQVTINGRATCAGSEAATIKEVRKIHFR